MTGKKKKGSAGRETEKRETQNKLSCKGQRLVGLSRRIQCGEREKASVASSNGFERQRDGRDEGARERGTGRNRGVRKEEEEGEKRCKHAEKELQLKGTAGYQPARERCRDAGRCDMVTFASTNGLSGFSRAVWCDAPRL